MIKTSAKLLTEAGHWIGAEEGGVLHQSLINTFNAEFKGYKMSYTEPWCAAGLSAIFILARMGDLIPIECSVPRMYVECVKMGMQAVRTGEAEPGDIVFYDWGGDGVLDHVGIIEKVNKNIYQVIECNVSNRVGRRYIHQAAPSITAVLRPKYDKGTEQEGAFIAYATRKSMAFSHHYLPHVESFLALRTGPGTGYDKILEILPGERLTCWGYYELKGNDPWLYVIHDKTGKQGYCSLFYLRIVPGE